MPDFTYSTHTGLTVHKLEDTDIALGFFRVYIEGDRQIKPLYSGNDRKEAERVFEEVKAHFEKRKADEAPEVA